MTLDSPVAYSKAISPVCLPLSSDDADQYAGQDAVLMGWGKLKLGIQFYSCLYNYEIIFKSIEGDQSDTLQQARGRILTSYVCWTNYHLSFVNSMLCTSALVQSTCTVSIQHLPHEVALLSESSVHLLIRVMMEDQ